MNKFLTVLAAICVATSTFAFEPNEPDSNTKPETKTESNETPTDTPTPDTPELKEVSLQFDVEGYEFRNYNSYPEDNKGSGYEANAWNSYLDQCELIESDARDLHLDNFVSFDCGEEQASNISEKPRRVRYRSEATLVLKAAMLFSTQLDSKVDGPRILANTHRDAGELKWQVSRGKAREGYETACADFKASARSQYGDVFLFAVCGNLQDDGGSTGWHFFSQPQLFLAQEGGTSPGTGTCDGRAEGETWWENDENEKVNVEVQCGGGTSRVDTYYQENEYKCVTGQVQSTGETRRGDYLESKGQCLPRDCGDRNHGDTWEVEVPGTVERSYSCRSGGTRTVIYSRVQERYCFDGDIKDGDVLAGEYIRTVGSCRDDLRCSNGADHGDRWWQIDWGNPIYERRWCGPNRRGKVTNVYAREALMICDFGSIFRTGISRKMYLIDSYGHCRRRPDRPHPRPMRPRPMRPHPKPMRPHPMRPRPMRPRPMRPEPMRPRPMRPRPMRPEPMRPRPMRPRPMRPEPMRPRPMRPRPMRPEPMRPRPMRPRPMRPEPMRPRPMRPRPMRPEPMRPRPMRPRPMRPEPMRPRPMRPRPMRPEPMRPRPMRPAPRPQPMRPRPMRPAPRPQPMRPAPRPMRPRPMRPGMRPMRPRPMRPGMRPRGRRLIETDLKKIPFEELKFEEIQVDESKDKKAEENTDIKGFSTNDF